MAGEDLSFKEKVRAFVFKRQHNYALTFDSKSDANKAVLSDLAKFCRADESTFHADERIHAVLEGRREVWLRIQQHLKMDPETLWSIFERKGG